MLSRYPAIIIHSFYYLTTFISLKNFKSFRNLKKIQEIIRYDLVLVRKNKNGMANDDFSKLMRINQNV